MLFAVSAKRSTRKSTRPGGGSDGAGPSTKRVLFQSVLRTWKSRLGPSGCDMGFTSARMMPLFPTGGARRVDRLPIGRDAAEVDGCARGRGVARARRLLRGGER